MGLRRFVGLVCLVGLWFGVAGAQKRPQVAITFDDLPAHGELPPGVTRVEIANTIVKALHAAQVPAVYGFINGTEVAGSAELEPALQVWRDGGELLGNHTFTHPDINNVTAARFEADIAGNTALLEKFMPGEDWHWFRYPYLHEGDTGAKRHDVRRYLKAQGYRVAEVTIDFEDSLWNDPYARCMVKHDDRAVKRLHDTYLATADHYLGVFRGFSRQVYGRDIRYILLLHEGAFDAKMLPELLAIYKRHGFDFVTLEEAEADPIYARDPDIADKDGGTFLEQVMERRNIKIPQLPKPTKMLDAICQ